MIYFVPAISVFLIQVYLFVSWWKSRKRMDGKEKRFILFGFLLGQIFFIWEVLLVEQTGKPLPGSPEQNMLMVRLLLGGSLGGLFVIIGLFYLSLSAYGQSKNLDHRDKQ